MVSMKEMKFDLALKEVPVVLFNSATGESRQCRLVEMDGERRGLYTERSSQQVELNEDGKVKKVLSYQMMDVLLLSCCLFDENGKLISPEELLTYPSRILDPLRSKAQEINGLSDTEKEMIKNESKVSGTGGSE